MASKTNAMTQEIGYPQEHAQAIASITGAIDADHVCGAARCKACFGVNLRYSKILRTSIASDAYIESDGNILKSLSHCIETLMESLDVDSAKRMQIALNNSRYQEAVKSIWKDPEASRLILDHTNAFYVRKDDLPKKGFPSDEDYVVCEVCVDDALIRSEIDAHRELLEFALRSNGLSFEEFRIIPARHGMRNRHPFAATEER